MKSTFFFFLIVGYLSNFQLVFAQHCPFCGSAIIVVEVKDAVNKKPIEGLKIYFIDSVNGFIQSKYFAKNPENTNPNWLNMPGSFMNIRYSFANENYINIIDYQLIEKNKEKGVFIQIEDTLQTRKQKYETIRVKINPTNTYVLHDNIGLWYKLRDLKQSPAPKNPFQHEVKVMLKLRNLN